MVYFGYGPHLDMVAPGFFRTLTNIQTGAPSG